MCSYMPRDGLTFSQLFQTRRHVAWGNQVATSCSLCNTVFLPLQSSLPPFAGHILEGQTKLLCTYSPLKCSLLLLSFHHAAASHSVSPPFHSILYTRFQEAKSDSHTLGNSACAHNPRFHLVRMQLLLLQLVLKRPQLTFQIIVRRSPCLFSRIRKLSCNLMQASWEALSAALMFNCVSKDFLL